MSQATISGHGMPTDRLALGGRTLSQGMFGGIALVLGIVGLAIAGARADAVAYLVAIAQIALGVALIAFGAALAAAYARLVARLESSASVGGAVTGTTADMFLGGAVIILGILALLHVAPEVLVPVQVILVGVGLLLNSISSIRATLLELDASSDASPQQALARRVNEELSYTTGSMRAIAGIAVGILGILALVNPGTMIALTLVAAIVAGAAMLLASTSLSNRVIVSLAAHA